MPAPDVIAAFFCASFLLGLAPGPDNIFVLTQAALRGSLAGVMTTLGLMTGVCLQTLAVAAGVAVLIKSSPAAFMALKLLGCGYLLWLAWLEWRSVKNGVIAARPEFAGNAALYRRGIIMNITNPKVCLFFLAFLPQFCDPARGPVFWQIIFLGFLFILASSLVFFGVAILGGRLAEWLKKNERAELAIHRVAALIYVALAIALVFAETR